MEALLKEISNGNKKINYYADLLADLLKVEFIKGHITDLDYSCCLSLLSCMKYESENSSGKIHDFYNNKLSINMRC